mmetsp:Transcript_31838/g.58302  ORF Transcript_31838/g.58302 Transcript_31838/m.58302 type:complete len:472 (-) Transcript_31838:20-1435(-)
MEEADEPVGKKKKEKKGLKEKKEAVMEDAEEDQEEHTAADGNENGEAKPNKDVFKVYVGEIPFSWDKDTLRKHFSECGVIDWMHMPQDALGRPAGFAFISYWDQESVDAALELNGRYFGGRKLKVNMATDKPTKLPKEKDIFIGGLPFSCTEEVLRKDFSECGAITRLNMPLREDGSSKGIAFISYKKAQAVAEALKFHGTEYGGRTLTVRLSSQKPEPRSSTADDKESAGKEAGVKRKKKDVGTQDKGKNNVNAGKAEPHPFEVIVKGLGFKTKEDSLREELQECGEIESLRLPLSKRRKNNCLGYAFVIFQDKKGLKRALKLNGTEIGGREVRVERLLQKSTEKDAQEPEEPTVVVEKPPRKKQKLTVESGDVDETAGADVEPKKKPRRKAEETELEEEEGLEPTEEAVLARQWEDILARKKDKKERRKAERLAALENEGEVVETLTEEEIMARKKARRAQKLAASSSP